MIAIVLGILASTTPAAAAPCMAEGLAAIAEAQNRDDSLALAEHFLAESPDGSEACGQALAGYLIGMTSTPSEAAWRERQRGADLIEQALRSFPNEPRLYLAMGVLLHHRQSRTDALRALGRAEGRKDQSDAPLTRREVALIPYVRGLIQQDFWRDWRSFGAIQVTAQGQWRCSRDEGGSQDNFTSSSSDFSWLVPISQLCPARFTENMNKFFQPRSRMNADALDDLKAAFEAAEAADPTFFAPGRALLSEWVYAADWTEAERAAQDLAVRFPDDYRPKLYLGMVYHETGRDSLAAQQFGQAMRDLPPAVATSMEDIRPLLRTDQQAAYDQLDSAGQFEVRVAYWTSTDPLYLTTWNERRLEHWSRVVEARLLFWDTAAEDAGPDTFAGQMWIRYGRPRHIWELQQPAGRVVFWDIGDGPEVSFSRGFGYRGYRATDEGVQYANALARTSPQTYEMTTVADSVGSVDAQFVRTLGAGARPQVLVFGAWPDAAGPDAMAGVTMLDLQYFPVAQWRGRRGTKPGLTVELSGMAKGTYSLTLEVWDREARRLFRSRDTLTTLSLDEQGFAASDLLLVTAVESPKGDDVTSRRDLSITPLYGSVLNKGQSLGLVWETYRGTSRPGDRARYRVSIELLNSVKQPMLTRVLRGVGIGGQRRAATRIEYDSNRPVADGRTVEWLELASELPIGEYRLSFTITDRATGAVVTRERELSVR